MGLSDLSQAERSGMAYANINIAAKPPTHFDMIHEQLDSALNNSEKELERAGEDRNRAVDRFEQCRRDYEAIKRSYNALVGGEEAEGVNSYDR